mgnify:CR=1 FL=1
MVRLIDLLLKTDKTIKKNFNSNMVRLIVYGNHYMPWAFIYFNSNMVRLIVDGKGMIHFYNYYFNSNMVRLIVEFRPLVYVFQVHFNSNMVRLIAGVSLGRTQFASLFQFQYGSINRNY